jgi:hypothetical protein
MASNDILDYEADDVDMEEEGEGDVHEVNL